MTKQQPPETPPSHTPGYPVPMVVYQPEEPIDWQKYWRTFVQERKLIAIVTVASTLLATAIAFLITPTYRAEVLLAPVTEEKGEGLRALAGQFGDLAALAGVNIGSGKDKTAEHIAALKSRSLAVSFIKEKSLMPVLFASKWDEENKRWKDTSNQPTEWKAFEVWDEDIRRVSQDKRTGLVTLTIEWKDPALVAKWANDFAQHVNAHLRTNAVEEADKSITYLYKQLPQTASTEVQQAIYRLIEAQTKKKMVASTKDEYAFDLIDLAVPPEKIARPKRGLMIIGGILIGMMLSLGVAVYRSGARA